MHQRTDKSDSADQLNIHSKRLIKIKKVTHDTSISRSYIYQLCKKGLFPKSVLLVPGGTAVAWVEGEVHKWIDQRIQERDGGASHE